MRRIAVATALALVAATAGGQSPAPSAAAAPKVLRYALRIAETGFDPAQIVDLYSRTIAANIFEAPYQYEFLARPVRLRPSTAAALPEVSDDFKTFTIRIKPGIYFTDDPAFRRQAARADRGRLRLLDQAASSTRAGRARTCRRSRSDQHPRPGRAAPASARAAKPFDYDRDGRRAARASTATRCSSGSASRTRASPIS